MALALGCAPSRAYAILSPHSAGPDKALSTASPQPGRPTAFQAPVAFIRNDGQTDASIAYHVKGHGRDSFFARDGVTFALPDPKGGPSRIVGLRPLWLDAHTVLVPGRASPTLYNFHHGPDPAGWHTGVPAYEALTYRHPASGLELVWYGQGQTLEYDVIVPPGVDPGRARFRVEGAEKLRLDKDGSLVIVAGDASLVQAPPKLHQVIDGRKVAVRGRFAQVKKGPDGWTYGFAVAAYDRGKPLVIDPTLNYNISFAGNGADVINAVAVDANGLFACGSTTSTNLVAGATVTLSEAVVVKFRPSDGSLYWITYLGGSKDDFGTAIALTSAGDPVVAGQTNSTTNFPVTPKAFNQTIHGTSVDAFLAKLNKDSGTLTYCSYFGGSGTDSAKAVAVDGSGALYLAGSSDSTDLPTRNALYPAKAGSADGFVAKFSSDGTYLQYLTYLGGTGNDTIYAMAVDGQYNVYVAGETASADFPKKNALLGTRPGPVSAFVSKFNAAGTSLVYSTYLGGTGSDGARGLALDSSRNVYLTGKTTSKDFPVVNALFPNLAGDTDAFVAKLDVSGRFLWYATYLGGVGEDLGLGLAVEPLTGRAYVAGTTESANFPVVALLNNHDSTQIVGSGLNGSTDAFVAKIEDNGSQAIYSAFLGGLLADEGHGIALNVADTVYMVGSTTYGDNSAFPFYPAPTTAPSKKAHGFVARITDPGPAQPLFPRLALTTPSAQPGFPATFTLSLSNAGTSVGAFSANLVYNTSVLSNPVIVFDPRLALLKKKTVSQALATDTQRLSVYTDWTTATIPDQPINDGTIATVTFDVKADATSQFSGITLAGTASSVAGQNIQIECSNSGVQIQKRCGVLGDCDCSGQVELWELQNAVDLYVNGTNAPFCMVTTYGPTILTSDLTQIANNYMNPVADPNPEARLDAAPALGDGGSSAALTLGKAEKRADGLYLPVRFTAPAGVTVSAVATRIAYDTTAYAAVDAIIGPAAQNAGKGLLVSKKKPGVLGLMAINLSNAAAIPDGVVAYLKVEPVSGVPSALTALTQTPDASTPQGQAVTITGPKLALPFSGGPSLPALGILLQ
jgi:hypothetical protein